MNPCHPSLPLVLALLTAACASPLPEEPPPLLQMEEPLELFAEPDDEALRRDLPLGGFTGAYVGDARQTIEAMLGEAQGVEVVRIVENSPADIAGLKLGDVLQEARVGDGPPRQLRYPSDWRAVELAAGEGAAVTVVFDRANRRTSTTIHTIPRLRPVDRAEVVRIREEQRVGVVLRTATEVEARRVGLPPGAGAVVVGLSKNSPWRVAGIRFGDLIAVIDERRVAHPEVVLDAIRNAGDEVDLVLWRDGVQVTVVAPLTRRARDFRELYVPLLVDHESGRGKADTSVLLGLFRYQETRAAWRVRLFWIIWFGGGDADELLEVDS